jgi:hypothetical protein
MNIASRLLLLIVAASCGGFMALLGAVSSAVLDGRAIGISGYVFWVLSAAVLVSPLWVPALIPSHWPRLLSYARRIGALCLLFPLYLFFSIVSHNVGRMLRGWEIANGALSFGLIATVGCVTSLIVLLWPDLHRLITAAKSKGT